MLTNISEFVPVSLSIVLLLAKLDLTNNECILIKSTKLSLVELVDEFISISKSPVYPICFRIDLFTLTPVLNKNLVLEADADTIVILFSI